jgi:hypothetical protein
MDNGPPHTRKLTPPAGQDRREGGTGAQASLVTAALPACPGAGLAGRDAGRGDRVHRVAAEFAGQFPARLVLAAVAAGLAGVLVTVAAALLPAQLLRRLPTAQLLAEE